MNILKLIQLSSFFIIYSFIADLMNKFPQTARSVRDDLRTYCRAKLGRRLLLYIYRKIVKIILKKRLDRIVKYILYIVIIID